MRFTFICSIFNTSVEYLDILLKSLVSQTNSNYKILLLDNGSNKKESIDCYKKYLKSDYIRLLHSRKNLGIIGGMKLMLDAVDTEYYIPVDSDDVVSKDAIKIFDKYASLHPSCVSFYSDEDKITDDSKPFMRYFKPNYDPVLLAHSCYIAHLCCYKVDTAKELDFYSDPQCEGCHDWDSHLRLISNNIDSIHIPICLYTWRIHQGSTSGNINSKKYISDSHLAVLTKFANTYSDDIIVSQSYYFNGAYDWCFKQKHISAGSINNEKVKPIEISISSENNLIHSDDTHSQPNIVLDKNNIDSFMIDLKLLPGDTLCLVKYDHHKFIETDWLSYSLPLFSLFKDIGCMSGSLLQNGCIIDGPRVFGFGSGIGSPYKNRTAEDLGYFAQLKKPHSCDSLPSNSFLIKASILKETILNYKVMIESEAGFLPIFCSLQAQKLRMRSVINPFMDTELIKFNNYQNSHKAEELLSVFFWRTNYHLLMNPSRNSYYPRGLSLDSLTPFIPALNKNRQRHLFAAYESSVHSSMQRSVEQHIISQITYDSYISTERIGFSFITTIYPKTNYQYLNELIESVFDAGFQAGLDEWIVVMHGAKKNYAEFEKYVSLLTQSGICILFVEKDLCIMEAMKTALIETSNKYIIPLDSDDLITKNSLNLVSLFIEKNDFPDLLYSDEDMLINGCFANTYKRQNFDPYLTTDSSVIWHLCIIKRSFALEQSIYSNNNATWCHDYNTLVLAYQSRCQIIHIPFILYAWRQHGLSSSNQNETNQVSQKRSYDSVVAVQETILTSLNQGEDKFEVVSYPDSRGSLEPYITIDKESLNNYSTQFRSDVSLLVFPVINKRINYIFSDSRLSSIPEESHNELARLIAIHGPKIIVSGRILDHENIIVSSHPWGLVDGTLFFHLDGKEKGWAGSYQLYQKVHKVSRGNHTFFGVSSLLINKVPNNCLTSIANLYTYLLLNEGISMVYSPLFTGIARNSSGIDQ